MNRNLLISLFVIVVLLGAGYVILNLTRTASPDTATPNGSTPTTSEAKNQITFPRGNETLIKGRTYPLQWTGGPDPTQIFLIDTTLESQGTSVSISDRVYNIPNTGTYQYTIPENISDGIYKLQIGDQTSNPFTIATSDENNQTSYCNTNDLQATITLEGAAGSTYGRITLQNTANQACQLIGDNLIQFTSDATNLTTATQGQSNMSTLTLEPNQTIYSQIRYPNGAQCLSETKTASITFTYQITPNQIITFADANNQTEFNITICSAATEQTEIQVWGLNPNPITN